MHVFDVWRQKDCGRHGSRTEVRSLRWQQRVSNSWWQSVSNTIDARHWEASIIIIHSAKGIRHGARGRQLGQEPESFWSLLQSLSFLRCLEARDSTHGEKEEIKIRWRKKIPESPTPSIHCQAPLIPPALLLHPPSFDLTLLRVIHLIVCDFTPIASRFVLAASTPFVSHALPSSSHVFNRELLLGKGMGVLAPSSLEPISKWGIKEGKENESKSRPGNLP